MEGSRRGRHACHICGFHFALNASLKAHMKKHSPQEQPSNSNSYDTSPESSIGVSKTDPNQGFYEQHFAEQLKNDIRPQPTTPLPSYSTPGCIYRCSECQKIFDSRDKLTQHQNSKNHRGVNEFNIGEGMQLNLPPKSSNGAANSTESHSDHAAIVPPFYCSICGRYFDSQDKFNQHNASLGHQSKLLEKSALVNGSDIVDEPANTAFICNFNGCGKVFDTTFKLLQHQNMKKHNNVLLHVDGVAVKSNESLDVKLKEPPQPETLVEEMKFPCEISGCERTFPSMERLLQHRRDKHPNLNGLSVRHGLRSPSVEVDSEGSEHNCGECGKEFDEMRKLLQHIGTKHEDPASKEPPVPYLSISTASYRRLCDQCDEFNEASKHKSFIFLTYIAKHILKCHAPPNYVRGFCPICNTKLEKTKNLLAHIARAHLFSKFSNEACFICLRLCKDADELQQHTTAVHRFKCLMDECNSMFASKPLRDKHMLQKHGVHVCGRDDCMEIFKSVEEKMRHMATPHFNDTDSDSGFPSVYSNYNQERNLKLDTGSFSDQPRTSNSYQMTKNNHHSADELSKCPQGVALSQPPTAAHRLLVENLHHLQKVLKELKEPLNKPSNISGADETVRLCDEIITDLSQIRERYSDSHQSNIHFKSLIYNT